MERRRRFFQPDPAWHRAQLAEAEQAGQWFAVLFHLNRLLALETKPEVRAALIAQRTRILSTPSRAIPKTATPGRPTFAVPPPGSAFLASPQRLDAQEKLGRFGKNWVAPVCPARSQVGDEVSQVLDDLTSPIFFRN